VGGSARYRTGRAVGGLLQGAGMGLAFGSFVGGVPAMATFAVVGGLTTLVTSLRESASEIRDVKIGRTIEAVSNRLDALARGAVRPGDAGDAEAVTRIRSARASLVEKSYDEGGRWYDFFTGQDHAGIDALLSKNLRQSFGGQLGSTLGELN